MRKSREARAHRQVELQHAPGKLNTSCDRGPQHADPQRAIPEFAVALLLTNFHDLTPVPRARSAGFRLPCQSASLYACHPIATTRGYLLCVLGLTSSSRCIRPFLQPLLSRFWVDLSRCGASEIFILKINYWIIHFYNSSLSS